MNETLLEALRGIPGMENGRRLVAVWGQLGDFDSLEYAQALVPVLAQLEQAGIELHAFAIGNAAGRERFCSYSGFPLERLTVVADNTLHQDPRPLQRTGQRSRAMARPAPDVCRHRLPRHARRGGARLHR